ncbi:MAG: leukotoxin LktA family filamentous adhesin [Endomicrobia bacterium]|nr:leukotoxin LktA family filamentous adhesin [Endomicrobiia bacterium]
MKKIISWVVAAAFLCSQTGFAQVVSDKSFTAVTNVDANTQQVTTTLQSGNTGFNSFSKFNVDAGKTVNLIMDGMNNLVNLINDSAASQINGIVNALRNGKIGGNVFFLNPNGIIIGASGIVNVGSLTLAVPSQAFMDSVIDGSNNVNSLAANAILAGDMPINPSGTISIKGKVNAYYGADIYADNIEVSGQDAQINTLKAVDPSYLVNMDAAPPTEIQEIGGRILITGKKIDIKDGASVKSAKDEDNGFDKAGDIQISAHDNATKLIAEAKAEINIENAAIEGNNVSIEASAKNDYSYEDVKVDWSTLYEEIKNKVKNSVNADDFGEIIKDLIDSGFNFDDMDLSSIIDLNGIEETVTEALNVNTFIALLNEYVTEKISGAYAKSDVNAKITIGDGSDIKADETLNIKTDVYSKTNIDIEVDAVAAAVGFNTSASEINIKNGAALESSGETKIEALSTVVSDLRVKTTEGYDLGENNGTLGVVMSAIDNATRIKIENDAVINSEDNISIDAITDKKLDVKISGPENENGNLGVGIIYNDSTVNNEVTANGSIISQTGSVSVNSEIKQSKNNFILGSDDVKNASGALQMSFVSDNNNNSASVNIGENALINAGNDINIFSKALSGTDINAVAKTTELGNFTISAIGAFTDTKNNSLVNIGKNSVLNAGQNVNLKSETGQNLDYFLQSLRTKDQNNTNFGVSAIYDITKTNNSINAHGDITAQNGDINTAVSMDTSKNINKKAAEYNENEESALNINIAYSNNSVDENSGIFIGDKNNASNSLTAGKNVNISADINSAEYILAKSSLMSAAVKDSGTSVKVNIENAVLNAGDNIDIAARTKETDNITAHSVLKRDNDSKNLGVSAAILLLDNKTSVNIGKDAVINAGKDVNITASTVKDLISSAEIGLAGSGEKLSLGLIYAYNDIKTDNDVLIEGEINAGGNVSVNSSITAEKNTAQASENGGNWDKRVILEAANSALTEADKKVKENEKLFKVTQDVSEAFNKNGDGSDIPALIYDIALTVAENPQEAAAIAQALADKLSEEDQSGAFPDIAAAWQSVCGKIETDFNSAKTDAASKKEAQQKAQQDYEKSSGGNLSTGIAVAQNASYDNSALTVSGDISGKSVNLISDINKKSENAYTKSDGLAVSVNDNHTSSNVTINSPVTATGAGASDAINISANANVAAKTETKTGSMSISSFESAAGAAISNVHTDNSVNVNAKLDSQNDVTVKAATNKNIMASVEALPGNDANLGLGLVYNDSISNNTVNISDDIIARSGDINILSELTDKNETKSMAKSGNIVRNNDTANKKFGIAGAVAYITDDNNAGINIGDKNAQQITLTSGKDLNIVSLLNLDSKIIADGAGVAVAIVENTPTAIIDVRNTAINSGNDINIKSTLNIKYALESLSGMMTILSFDGGAAAAISTVISENIISITDSVINAVKNITISALTNAEMSVSASALTGKASNAGVAVSDAKSDIYNEVEIKDSEINSQTTDIMSAVNSKENANNSSSGTGNEDNKNPTQDDNSGSQGATINLMGFELPNMDFGSIFNFDFGIDFGLGGLQLPSLDFSKIFFDFGLGSVDFPKIDFGGILSKIGIGDFSLPGMPSLDLSGLLSGINLGQLNLGSFNIPNIDIGKIFDGIGLGNFDLSGLGIPDIIGNLPDLGFLNFNFGDMFGGFDFQGFGFGGLDWDWFKMGSMDWGRFNPSGWDWASLNPKNLDFDWALDFGIDWLRNGGGSSTPENKVAIGGTLALGDHTKTAEVNIDNVTFASKDDININAAVIDADIKSSAEAGIKHGASFEVAGAVIYSHYNDYARATVNNSRLNAGGTISVNSLHLIPMTGEEWLNDFNGKSITELAQTAYDKLKGGPLDALRDNLVNFWVRSSAATTGTSQNSNSGSGNGGEGGSGDESGFSAGGGVNILYFDFASEASITNSEINQNTNPLYRTGNQKVEVKANSDTTLVNVGGILGDLGSSAALGGIYNQITYDDSTKAHISNSNVYANKADIISNYKQHDITIGVAGASAGDFALEGVLNMLDSTANVDAYIDGGKVEISGGELKVDAANDSLFVNVAGAVDISNKISVGLTGAVNEILRNTNAYIKNINDLRAGSIDISAVNDGIIHSYSIAGTASTKPSNNPGIIQGLKNKAADWLEGFKKSNKNGKKTDPGNTNNEGSYQSAGNDENMGAFGLGISGSASINDIDGYAQAYIENVTIKDSGDINISAQENSKITSASGAVALNLQSGEGSSGLTLAGTASINLTDVNAVTYIKNSTIENAGNIALNSLSASLIQAVAISLPISTTKSGVNIAGSVTVNKIESEKGIISFVENSVIKASELLLNAKEKSEIKSLAGALSLTTTSVAIGASVGVNTIKNTISAYLLNTDAEISGKIDLLSQNIAKIETLAVTAGISINSIVDIAASVVVNRIENKTESYIEGKKNTGGNISAEDIAVIAEDESEIGVIAAELSLIGTVDIGGAVGVNKIENTINAYIKDAAVNSIKNIDIRALSSGIIKFIDASLGGSKKAAIVGSVGINDIDNAAKAGIYGSDVYAGGSIGVFAQNTDYIQLISGAIGIGSTVGISGDVGLNYISNKSIAEILSSNVTALGKHSLLPSPLSGGGQGGGAFTGLLVYSNIDDKIDVYNAAAAGAGTVAASGGLTGAVIENESIAKIQNSEINQNNTEAGENQNVSVLADNKIEVTSYGGALDGAGTVALGLAGDFLTIDNEVEAGIINSSVKASNDIQVKTNSKEKYDVIVVAGAGSGGVSIAGSVAVVQSDVKNNAYITGSETESGKDTTVEAKDEIILGGDDLGMAVGSGAGALYAGIDGAVLVGKITNKTNALISNSNVNAGNKLNVLADSTQKVKSSMLSMGGAFVGLGATVSVMNINTKTSALVLADGANTNLETGQDINVEAKNKLMFEELLIGTGGGFVGVGATVSVGNINNDVSAGIDNNVKASAGRDVNVNAQNQRDIESIVATGAGGFVGVEGSVAVMTIGGNINSNDNIKKIIDLFSDELDSVISISGNYNEANAGSNGLTSEYIADMNKLDITTEKLYGPTTINNGTNAFIGAGAQITAGNDINVKAEDILKFDNTVGGMSGGFVGVGASVNIVDITTLANTYVDNGAILKANNNINVISNSNVDELKMWTLIASGGFAAANAAVSILDVKNDSYAAVRNNVQILRANEINILANAKSRIEHEIDRVTAGLFTTGATVATTTKKGTTQAIVGDNVKIRSVDTKEQTTYEVINNLIGTDPETGDEIYGEPTIIPHTETIEIESGAGSLTVKAVNDNVIKTTSISGITGAGAAQANIFDIDITDNINAFIGKNSNILLNNDLLIKTDGYTKGESTFLGVELTGGLSIGVADTNLTINLGNHSYLDEDGKVMAKNVSVGAKQNTEVEAEMQGFSIGAVIFDGSKLSSIIHGNLDAKIGKGNTIFAENDIVVGADSKTKQELKTLSLEGGLIAAGLASLQATTDLNVKSELSDKLNLHSGDTINLKTDSNDKLYSQVESGAGGGFIVGGSQIITTNNSTNKVIIGSDSSTGESNITTGAFQIEANAISDLNGSAETTSINLGESARSTITNTSNSILTIDVLGKTNIYANNIIINALNKFVKDSIGKNIDSFSVSGLNLYQASSITTVNNTTKINFGKDTYLKTYKDENKQSLFEVNAVGNVSAYDKAKFESVSGGSASKIESKIYNNSTQEINFNGKAAAADDLEVSARVSAETKSITDINAVGLGSYIAGISESENNINNTININGGAELFSNGEARMYMSRTEGEASIFNSRATTDLYLSQILPWTADSAAKSRININDVFNVKEGGSLKSVGSIIIDSYNAGACIGAGIMNVTVPISATLTRSSNEYFEVKRNSYAQIDGEVIAGVNSEIKINILGDYIDGENRNLKIDIYKNGGEEVDHADISYEVTREDMESNLLEQRELLYELLIQYSGSDSESYIRNQITRVEEELLKLDLMEIDIGSGERMLKEAEMDYITFSDIRAGMGEIKINMNNLGGKGKISASDNAVISIDNNSAYNLRFNDIEILSKEGAGRIVLNETEMNSMEDIKKMNNDTSVEVNFAQYTLGSGQNLSGILINSNYSFVVDEPYIKPMIELTGDVTNIKGLIQIGAQGNIVTMGRLVGDSVRIISTEGNIVQNFIGVKGKNGGAYVYHSGGAPSNDWKVIAQSNAEKYAGQHNELSTWTGDESSNTPVPELKKSEIIGNNVYISGEYLDINGLVQAGVADWNLNITDNNIKVIIDVKVLDAATGKPKTGTIAEALAYYNEMHDNVKSFSPSFKLAEEHGNATAYYNVKTGEIELQNIYAEGGKLELYGHILNTSTSGQGQLVALDGYARANIVNDSEYKINIKNIDTSNRVEGSIYIMDKGQTGAGGIALETLYTFNGADIVKKDNKTVDEEGNGNNIEILSGKEALYSTKEGQRYVWTNGTQQVDRKTYKKSSTSFAGITLSESSLKTFSVINYERLNYTPLYEIERVDDGLTTDPLYMYAYKRDYTGQYDLVDSWTKTKKMFFGLYKEYTRYAITEQGIKNFNTNSIKADNPISIGFIGYGTAQDLIVSSKSDINLKGTINAGSADAYVTSRQSIDSLGVGKIAGNNVNINAVNGIGNTNVVNVNLFGGVLNAYNTTAGDINIYAKNTQNTDNTYVGDIINGGNGKVILTSDKSIIGIDENAKIKGKSIELTSKLGDIEGANGEGLEIDTELIKVNAYGDINLVKNSGDLGVYKIESITGDVILETRDGSILDKSEKKEMLEEMLDEQIAKWTELGLFEHGWTLEQLIYAIKLNETDDNKEATISGNNVSIKASENIGKTGEGFSFETDKWNSLTLEQKQEAANAQNVTISEDNMIMNVSGNEKLYVYAKEGINAQATENINIGSGKELNVRGIEAGGNINISGTEGVYNRALNNGINVKGVNVNINGGKEDIGAADKYFTVDVAGNLTAYSQKNIYINSYSDVALNTINAGEVVSLEIDGDIINALTDSRANITGNTIDVKAENIGERDNNITVSLTGENSIINMQAEDSLYINNVSSNQNLYVGTIEAENDAVINSENGDILAYDEDSYVSAKNIEFNAKEGNIGSKENKLKVTDFELVSSYAKENIDIEIINVIASGQSPRSNPVYNIGNIKSEEGYIDMYSGDSGINLKGEVEAKENINADIYGNISDDVGNNTAGFYSKNINLKSKTGKIGSKDNSIRIGDSPSHVIPENSNRESTLTAESEEGVYIESNDTIVVSKVEAKKSNVRLESKKSIKAKKQENEASNIIAQNIELKAEESVGEENNRLITETTKEKGRINIDAGKNIYIKQNGKNVFYSDYIRNHNDANVSLLLPGSNAYIVDLDIENPNKFRVNFLDSKYKNNISIGHNAIEKLAIHPQAVRHSNNEEEIENEYELLKNFKDNIIIAPGLLNLFQQLNAPIRLISKLTEEK